MTDQLKFTETSGINNELYRLSKSLSRRDLQPFVDNVDHKVLQIIEHTSLLFECTISELKSQTRKRPMPQIRQVLMWYFHKELGLSLSKAGSYFDGSGKTGTKDHATVIHSCKVVANRDNDYLINSIYNQFIQRFN